MILSASIHADIRNTMKDIDINLPRVVADVDTDTINTLMSHIDETIGHTADMAIQILHSYMTHHVACELFYQRLEENPLGDFYSLSK